MAPPAVLAPIRRSVLASIVDALGARGANAVHGPAAMPEPGLAAALALPGPGATLEELGKLEQAIEDIYGPRAGSGVLLVWGRERFDAGRREFAARSLKHRLAALLLPLPLLPLELRLHLVLRRVVEDANRTKVDAARLEENQGSFLVIYYACSCRYRPPQDHPCCFTTLGLLARAVDWAGGRSSDVREVSCASMDADACRFLIPIRLADSREEAADSL